MIEAAYVLGFLSAAILVASCFAWLKLLRSPALLAADDRVDWVSSRMERASQLLVLATGLSAAAAAMAILSLIGF